MCRHQILGTVVAVVVIQMVNRVPIRPSVFDRTATEVAWPRRRAVVHKKDVVVLTARQLLRTVGFISRHRIVSLILSGKESFRVGAIVK